MFFLLITFFLDVLLLSINLIEMMFRIGVHIYPIFSPRSNLVVITWLGVFGINYVFYKLWNIVIQNHMEYMHMNTLLGIVAALSVSTAMISFILAKYKASFAPVEKNSKNEAAAETK